MNLYDNEGLHIGVTEYEALDADERDQILHSGNAYYIWNQRNAQWRLAEKMVNIQDTPIDAAMLPPLTEQITPL